MAIKINNKDMSRRVYNDEDVQRVILNWSQIRPTEIPHIDYHVISDFTWWWGWWGWGVPDWWETDEWVVTDWNGIRSRTWQTVHARYTWMPSLLNAKRIEIITEFYWNWLYNINEMAFANYIVNPSYEQPNCWWYLYHDEWDRWHPLIRLYEWVTISQPLYRTESWIYFLKTKFELEQEWWQDIKVYTKEPEEEVYRLKNAQSITELQVQKIRESQYFDLRLWQSVIVKKVDFYIYNN